MSTNNEEQEHEEMNEGGENASPGSRVCAPETGQDGVSVSKSIDLDGAERTFVIHPPRKLRTPGEIKAAYEAGDIDLNTFISNVQEGLNAMTPVLTTETEGSGKDRVTRQKITMVPDFAMRLKWQDHITNTVEGMPVKRQEIVSRKVTTEEDLIRQAKKSPALARAILKTILKILDPDVVREVMEEHSKNGGGK